VGEGCDAGSRGERVGGGGDDFPGEVWGLSLDSWGGRALERGHTSAQGGWIGRYKYAVGLTLPVEGVQGYHAVADEDFAGAGSGHEALRDGEFGTGAFRNAARLVCWDILGRKV